MLAAVLALTLTSDPSWCDNIRAVRALAHRDHLDETSLAEMERRYCAPFPEAKPATAAAPPKASAECSNLWTMAVLARASRDYAELPAIDAQVRLSCALGKTPTDSLRWTSGTVAHQGDAWWYPSGRGAKKGASWWYPTGTAAHDAITWWYPSGGVARSGDVWFDPETGSAITPDVLLAKHCAKVPTQCNPRMGAMRGVSDEGHTAGLIELVLATP